MDGGEISFEFPFTIAYTHYVIFENLMLWLPITFHIHNVWFLTPVFDSHFQPSGLVIGLPCSGL